MQKLSGRFATTRSTACGTSLILGVAYAKNLATELVSAPDKTRTRQNTNRTRRVHLNGIGASGRSPECRAEGAAAQESEAVIIHERPSVCVTHLSTTWSPLCQPRPESMMRLVLGGSRRGPHRVDRCDDAVPDKDT